MSILKRKVCCFMTLPRTLQETFHYFSFSSIPSTFSSAFQLSSDSFFSFSYLLNLHQAKRNSRLTISCVWKTLCFHHISCSCLLLYEYKFGYDYDRCGSSKYQFFTPSLTTFPHTNGDGRKEFLHRIINCFYLLIYLIVLKNK